MRHKATELKLLVGALILIVSVCHSDAQAKDASGQAALPQKVADSTKIHFHQSQYDLDLTLDNNEEKLKDMLGYLHKLAGQDSIYALSTLRVVGSASPEGSMELNRRLSRQRAQTIFDFFAEKVAFPDSVAEFEFTGRNWKGLYLLVQDDESVPYRDEVIGILRTVDDGYAVTADESNALLSRIKALRGGRPYAYMYKHLFPALRYLYLYVKYEKRKMPEPPTPLPPAEEAMPPEIEQEAEEEITEPIDTVAEEPVVLPVERKPFYMSLRTNMLYDIAAVPNIAAEFYLGRNISVFADWMYAWWHNDSRHRYWRIYGGNVGARWWFGKKADEKPLTGHHLGAYGGIVTFDFEWGGKGYIGGKPGGTLWDRYITNVAVEYGYSKPIGRRLNLDFTAAFGYFSGLYAEYEPWGFTPGYVEIATKRKTWIGPTKLEVSLVWLIGRDNVNKKKGGGL